LLYKIFQIKQLIIKHLNSIFKPVIDVSDVLQSLNTLKLSFSPGPDRIPSCILRNCSSYLALPVTLIFNLSLSQCRFPSIWKESFIIPLLKKGNKSDISNYRGIAKLSSIPKLFEKIITCQLQHHCRSIISPCQHGFTRCRSTSTNLLESTSLITTGFLTHHQTDVIYTDFSKAFDSVNHRILIYKLSLLGFPTRVDTFLPF